MAQESYQQYLRSKFPLIRAGAQDQANPNNPSHIMFLFTDEEWAKELLKQIKNKVKGFSQSEYVTERTEGDKKYYEVRVTQQEYDEWVKTQRGFDMPEKGFLGIVSKVKAFLVDVPSKKLDYKRNSALIIMRVIKAVYESVIFSEQLFVNLASLFELNPNYPKLFNENPEFLINLLNDQIGKVLPTFDNDAKKLAAMKITQLVNLYKSLEKDLKKNDFSFPDIEPYLDDVLSVNNINDLLKKSQPIFHGVQPASSSSAPTSMASMSNFNAPQSFLQDIQEKMTFIKVENLLAFNDVYEAIEKAFTNINSPSVSEDDVLSELNNELFRIFLRLLEDGMLNDEVSCVAALRIMMLASIRTDAQYSGVNSGENALKLVPKIFAATSIQDIAKLEEAGYCFFPYADVSNFYEKVKEKFPVITSSAGSVSTTSSSVSTVSSTSSAATSTPPSAPPAPAMLLNLLGKSQAEIENDKAAKEINITAGVFNGLEKILDPTSPVKWPEIRAKIVALFKEASIQSKEVFKQEWSKYLTERGILFKQDGTSQEAFTGLERRLVLAYGNKDVKRKAINTLYSAQEGLLEELKKFGGVQSLRKAEVNHGDKKTDTAEPTKPSFGAGLKKTGSPLLTTTANTAQQQPQPNPAEPEAEKTTGLKQ